jgi:Asp/Glu/hydantoin racemase
MQKLALLSTGTGVIPSISKIVKDLSPETQIINFVDDGIIKAIAANDNVIPPQVYKRLFYLMLAAELSGAEAILVTCSSISEFIDYARPYCAVPLYKIDEPMIRKAISCGDKIGVVATVETTLAPTLRQVKTVAASLGKEIILANRLVAPAFEAFQRGETDLHDSLVNGSIIEMCNECDVVLLAQASMLSVVSKLDKVYRDKVLSSPYLGVKHVLECQKA